MVFLADGKIFRFDLARMQIVRSDYGVRWRKYAAKR